MSELTLCLGNLDTFSVPTWRARLLSQTLASALAHGEDTWRDTSLEDGAALLIKDYLSLGPSSRQLGGFPILLAQSYGLTAALEAHKPSKEHLSRTNRCVLNLVVPLLSSFLRNPSLYHCVSWAFSALIDTGYAHDGFPVCCLCGSWSVRERLIRGQQIAYKMSIAHLGCVETARGEKGWPLQGERVLDRTLKPYLF